MVADDVLEDQELYIYTSKHDTDITLEDDTHKDFEDEDITQSWKANKINNDNSQKVLNQDIENPNNAENVEDDDDERGPVNGVYLDTLNNYTDPNKREIEENSITQKTSVNRDTNLKREFTLRQFGKRKQPHKVKRIHRSLKSKNAKTNNNFKPYQKLQKIKRDEDINDIK